MENLLQPRALGVDYGEARIGLALSDELGMLAHPLQTLQARQIQPAREILRIAREKRAATIVIGLPRNMNGTEGPSAAAARALAAELETLAGEGGETVVLIDERLSTVEASRALHEAGHRAKAQKTRIDQGAARIILQSWLDRQAAAGHNQF